MDLLLVRVFDDRGFINPEEKRGFVDEGGEREGKIEGV